HLRRKRDDAHHGGDSVLEGERSGERLRHLTYARHSGLIVYGPHRWPEFSRLVCRYGEIETRLDVAFDFVAAHQLPRQRLHRVHVFARAAPGWGDGIL